MSTSETFSAEERAAIKERAKELRDEKKRASTADKAAADAQAQLDKIAELDPEDRALAERIQTIVAENAPGLAPKLWYGMPGYAKDGKIVCFLQPAAKFKTRYSTLGFNDVANLDDGEFWPVAFAVTSLTPADEKTIAELVKRAAS